MDSYTNVLKKKYKGIIREMSGRDRGPLGKIVKEITKIAKSRGIESNKAEVRDAIMVFATSETLFVKKHEQKRLEVIFKERQINDEERVS